jgi:hypothetical protein
LGYNTRFGSLVYAYLVDTATAGDRVYYPMMDSLFYDSSGHALMPHYRLISGIALTNRGTGIADCRITIVPSGENITRYNSRQTFQGPYDPSWYTNAPAITENKFNIFTGNIDPNLGGDVNSNNFGGSGVGGVYGIIVSEGSDAFNASAFDCGLTTHNRGVTTVPSGTSTIYWPAVETNTAPLQLSFRNILFYTATGVITEAAFDANTGLYKASPYFFCKPTGFFVHFESLTKVDSTATGPRLLPLHGIPNNQGNNNYQPLRGGAYPALSFDNGLELYFDITWSSPCGGALECNDPV